MKEKNFDFLEFFLNFLLGAILGGAFGFGIYASIGRPGLIRYWLLFRVFHFDTWDLYYSYPAASLFVGGGALIGGVLFALYKGPRGYW